MLKFTRGAYVFTEIEYQKLQYEKLMVKYKLLQEKFKA